MATLELCPRVVCGGGGRGGKSCEMPCHFSVQSLVLGAGNKDFPGHHILNYPGERYLDPCLASIFQMGIKAIDLLIPDQAP